MMETLRRVPRWPNRGKLYIHAILEEEQVKKNKEKKLKLTISSIQIVAPA